MADEFLQLYEDCYDDIYRYVYCKTGNPWDTDDIVSDVFLKAFRHFDPNRRTHKAWLVTIARNTTVDYYRKSGRELPGEAPEGNLNRAGRPGTRPGTDLPEECTESTGYRAI